MIAALIFAISTLTLLQFFVSYSRSLIAESQIQKLSEHTRDICGITTKAVAGDQFRRLLQLVALCPESGEDGGKLMTVSVYFRLLDFLRALAKRVVPSATGWIEAERSGCAYVAAVVLDHRIAHNRRLLAQQTSH
jgi:hypothetical protein